MNGDAEVSALHGPQANLQSACAPEPKPQNVSSMCAPEPEPQPGPLACTPETESQLGLLTCASKPESQNGLLTCASGSESQHGLLMCTPEPKAQGQSIDSQNQSGVPTCTTISKSIATAQVQPPNQSKGTALRPDPFPEFYPRGFIQPSAPQPEEAMSKIIDNGKVAQPPGTPLGQIQANKARDVESSSLARRRKLSARRQAYAASPTRTKTKPTLEEQWAKVENNLKRMELNVRSPFVPHTFSEYVAHVRSCEEAARKKELRKLKAAEKAALDLANGIKPVVIGPAFGGKQFNDGRTPVLALPSMWTSFESPFARPVAPWPSREEMREEGDERHTSGFKRFVPLPRVPDNASASWKQQHVLPQLPFDQVWPLPNAETFEAVRFKESPEELAKMEEMLGSDLMRALNCEDEDD